MKPLFPPLSDPRELPSRVLCLAPHSDDEVLGCGGMLAFHAARGDELRVVVLTDGSAGDPDLRAADIRAVREAESRAAGEQLGVGDHRFWGLPDGDLAGVADLEQRILDELEDFRPELVYAPSPQEMHPDHRVASRAVLGAVGRSSSRPRLHLYGVNAQVLAGVLYDVTAVWETKRQAMERFTSQLAYMDLIGLGRAVDRSRTVNIEDPAIEYVEGYADLAAEDALIYESRVAALLDSVTGTGHGLVPRVSQEPEVTAEFAATAVLTSWNKCEAVLENVRGLEAQEQPFAEIVVVDNASGDDTVARLKAEHPRVRVIVMPHSNYGACETFNIGFASVTTPLVAILDDDVVLPPDWLRKAIERLAQEPPTTAIVSSKVVEPGMPDSFKNAPRVNTERYMSTFRGCGSLARMGPLREAGFYDERLYIWGNERDLTCRLLNLGYRVLQYPGIETFHKTPFGMQMGKRSLYFHARNPWLTMLKYAPLGDLLRMPWLVLTKVILRGGKAEKQGEVSDAVGTIGVGKALRTTPGAPWILVRAAWSVLMHVPYCLSRREPVRAADFELPIS